MAKGNRDAGDLIGKMYGKTPYVVSAITGIGGIITGILLGDIYNLFHHNTHIGIPQLSHNDTNPSSLTNYNNSTAYLQNLLKKDNQTIYNLQNQVQNLQNSQALEKILFGNSSKDISIIKVDSDNINNGTAYIQGVTYLGDKEVTLEIPISYAEKKALIYKIYTTLHNKIIGIHIWLSI